MVSWMFKGALTVSQHGCIHDLWMFMVYGCEGMENSNLTIWMFMVLTTIVNVAP